MILIAQCLMLAASAAPAAPGWNPCRDLRDPSAIWECWSAAAGNHDGTLTTCVPKTSCPPKDQHGHTVQSCTYEQSFETGYRCIIFCNYGNNEVWGGDGGSNCG